MKIGKDIERYDWYYDPELFTEVIIDRLETEQYRNSTRICELLNQQAQRISELEEQLKVYIRPKFKVGQTVYTFNKSTECVYELCIKIIRIEINEISKFNSLVYFAERLEDRNFFGYFEVELFATKEEAIAKLKELGEKK